MGYLVRPLELGVTSVFTSLLRSVTNYANPASLGCESPASKHAIDLSPRADVGWVIPFTAVATSFTAILTQIFLGHRCANIIPPFQT